MLNAVRNPERLGLSVWPIPISLAATLRIDFSFSSWRYLDVSVHVVPLHTLWIYVWILEVCSSRFPHSDISGSQAICASPKLFAAYHVFHRLLVPRHSPYALSCLTIAWNSSDTIRLLMFVNCLCNLLNLFLDFFDSIHIFSFQGAVYFFEGLDPSKLNS